MWGITMFDQLACRIEFRPLRYEGRYTPPSLQGTIVYPGNFGTFNWGGVAVDPVRQVMFGMPTYLAFTSQLMPRDRRAAERPVTSRAASRGLNRNDGAPYAVMMGPFLVAARHALPGAALGLCRGRRPHAPARSPTSTATAPSTT